MFSVRIALFPLLLSMLLLVPVAEVSGSPLNLNPYSVILGGGGTVDSPVGTSSPVDGSINYNRAGGVPCPGLTICSGRITRAVPPQNGVPQNGVPTGDPSTGSWDGNVPGQAPPGQHYAGGDLDMDGDGKTGNDTSQQEAISGVSP